MNKQDFLVQLRKGLSGLPQDDIEERLTFYKEMIEDRMEEGFSESLLRIFWALFKKFCKRDFCDEVRDFKIPEPEAVAS